MLALFDPVRGMDYLSILVRLLTAAFCGGIIGLERDLKSRPAGFRVHILVCLGGAVAAMTGHFLYLGLGLPADITRIGAQVLSGMGFIGAGTILVTNNHSVKGLTTAAGIWTSGIIGVAVGGGFYEGGLLTTALLLLTQTLIARMDSHIHVRVKTDVTLRYTESSALDAAVALCLEERLAVRNIRVRRDPENEGICIAAITLQGAMLTREQAETLRGIPGVESIAFPD